MQKLFCFVLSVIFGFVCVTTNAQGGSFLKQNTFALLYLNTSQMYSIGIRVLEELLERTNRKELANAQITVRNLFNDSNIRLGLILAHLSNFLSECLIIPNGELWFSLDNMLCPTLAFDAKVSPIELIDYIKQNELFCPVMFENIDTSKFLAAPIRLSLCVDFADLILEILNTGIFISSKNNKSGEISYDDWSSITSLVQDDNYLAGLKIYLNKISSLEGNEEFISLMEFLKPVLLVELHVYQTSFVLSLSFSEESSLKDFEDFLNRQKKTILDILQSRLQGKKKDDPETRQILQQINSMKIAVEDLRLSFSAQGFTPETMVCSITTLLTAVALNAVTHLVNVRNTVAKSICNKMKNQLFLSAHNYLIENPSTKDGEILLETLFEKGFLESFPKCLSDGSYSIRVENFDIIVECSKHP